MWRELALVAARVIQNVEIGILQGAAALRADVGKAEGRLRGDPGGGTGAIAPVAVRRVVLDFEAALWEVLRGVHGLRHVNVKGCLFHLTQVRNQQRLMNR